MTMLITRVRQGVKCKTVKKGEEFNLLVSGQIKTLSYANGKNERRKLGCAGDDKPNSTYYIWMTPYKWPS